jgi:hypothetical protein
MGFSLFGWEWEQMMSQTLTGIGAVIVITQAGLHRSFKALADEAFPEGVKGTFKTNDLVQKMKVICLNETDDEDHKKIAFNNKAPWEQTVAQVQTYLKHK